MKYTPGQRASWARQAKLFRGVKKRGEFRATVKVKAPAEVLADRDARKHLEPVSLSQALLGDPPPGRSALDRRESGPNPRRDLLAGLVYRP